MKHGVLLSIALSIPLLAAACGPKSKAADTTGGGGDGDAVPSGPLAAGQWETLDGPTRAKFMGKVVKPMMKELFQTYDAEEFADFDCETCHGDGVKEGKFDMPNPELPQLSGDMIMKPDADMEAITEFMKTKVRPTMASLLGMPEWSPEAPDGFGCMHCHTPKP
jgi:hypothetical protein